MLLRFALEAHAALAEREPDPIEDEERQALGTADPAPTVAAPAAEDWRTVDAWLAGADRAPRLVTPYAHEAARRDGRT